jgi:hypothetical protein
MDNLSEEEKYRVALQVDHFIDLIEKRSGITFTEVISLVLWAREHKNVVGKLNFAASISIIGMAISAIAYGLLEGVKHIFGNGGK